LIKRLTAIPKQDSTKRANRAISRAQFHALKGGVQHGSQSQRVSLTSVSSYAVECANHFKYPVVTAELRRMVDNYK
jgi:hypothetical protein